MLISVCHAHLCDTSTSPLIASPPASPLDVLVRGLHQSMNSLTESGVLPGLFAWVPPLLSRLTIRSGTPTKVNDSVVRIKSPAEAVRASDSTVLFIGTFLRHALHQLSSMSVPSASEQHSPSLMHNMIAGLKSLLVAPLVMCIAGGQGVAMLLEENAALQKHSHDISHTNSKTDGVLVNWKSILTLWLELREFTVAHFGEEHVYPDTPDPVDSEMGSFAWIDCILSQDVSHAASVPFCTFIGSHAEKGDVSALSDQLKCLHTNAQFAQAALDVSVKHRRKYPLSALSTGLAITSSAVFVAVSVSLQRVILSSAASAWTTTELKDVDGLVKQITALFPAMSTHATELGGAKLAFVVAAPEESGDSFQKSLMEEIFSQLLLAVSALHRKNVSQGPNAENTSHVVKYVQQWTLGILSSLCAHHTATKNRSLSGFRTAMSALNTGEEHRSVVKAFAHSLTSRANTAVAAVDAEVRPAEENQLDGEMKDIIRMAWREVGGEDDEIFPTSTVSDSEKEKASSTAVAEATLPASAPRSTAGAKRSFAAALASPPPVEAVQLFTSPPTKVSKTDLPAPAPNSAYLKVSLPASEFSALAMKTSTARQGFAPATYTGVDRSDLNEKSQQSQQAARSQLLSQMDSQAMPPPLSPPQRHSNRILSGGGGGGGGGGGSASSSSMPFNSPTASAPAILPHQQPSQHSDSTTYVSPSPALAQTSSLQRRQSHLASFVSASAPRTPGNLPLLPEQSEQQTEKAVDSGSPMEIVKNENDLDQPFWEESASVALAAENSKEFVLHKASEELHRSISELCARTPNHAATASSLAPPPAPAVSADLLGAAIRQSHRLTGLLLDLLSTAASTTEPESEAAPESGDRKL